MVAGIDEAGFGPILGPLVVSAVVFELPDALVGADMWRALSPAVRKKPAKRHTGLAIGDSKKLYSPAIGLEHLERGALGMLGMATPRTAGLRSLLGWLCPPAVGQMQDYPWYRGADVELPAAVEAAGLRLRAKHVAAAMEAAGVRLVAARSEVVLVGQYNRLVAASDNKATTLLDHTVRLIDWAWRNRPDGQGMTVLVDRQGGREHYLPTLGKTFPDASGKKILIEEADHSGYRLSMGKVNIDVHFEQGGEDLHLPVALASMVSKYLRELFMRLENRYWAAQMAGTDLSPTAGYYQDGKRFLADIDAARRRLGTPTELLVRSR
jgi:hypothetical protein